MHANFRKTIDDLKASYWFIPTCMVALAIVLSVVMPWIDETHAASFSGFLSGLGKTQPDGARAVLGAIAGSIIGVAGTTFSITMVAVSFASSNFGPRLISNFMRDRGNQLTLGTFISTFVYSLLVLRRVQDGAAEGATADFIAFVPHLSVMLALLLTIASVGVLIYFIHHVPETINVDRLVSNIGGELRDSIESLFPRVREIEPDAPALGWDERTRGLEHTRITLSIEGFVQTLDLERLGELAEERALLVRVQYRPGDFVISSDVVADLWTKAPPDDDLLDDVRSCFALGRERTAHQNTLFLADQLVEVIGRALSPGVNDPFTAIACFNWLKSALVEFLQRESEFQRPDDSDPVRIYPIGFERLVAVIFDQTRQYVCADRNVAMHVLTVLTETAVRAESQQHRDTLQRRMDELAEASAEALTGTVGADDVAARHADARRILASPGGYETHRSGRDWFGGRA